MECERRWKREGDGRVDGGKGGELGVDVVMGDGNVG